HGVFVIERLLDFASRELGIDLLELRRRNFIPPDQFPYNNEIIFQDFTHLTYDSGNYEPILEKAKEMIGWDDFNKSKVQSPKSKVQDNSKILNPKSKIGKGLVMYVEGTGIGPYEGARIQVEPTGKVTVVTGVGTQGQGHYTTFAQVAADVLGIHVRDVYVSTGDSGQFNWGTGTFASRGAVVAGS